MLSSLFPSFQKIKGTLQSLLGDKNTKEKRYFDAFMIFLILASITILIAGKTVNIPAWIISFDLYFITSVFALEYLLRFWLSHNDGKYAKIRYLFSLPAIIDFLAIFPKFRIVRLLKLYHYMHGTSSLFQALMKKRFEFIFLGYLLFGVTFVLGSILYAFEYGVNEGLGSYLDAIYWALVTVSTVGYGDISPVTDIGKVVSMIGIIFGIAMISFVTSVMVSAFSERFDELRNADSINSVHKMNNVVVINGYGHLSATIAKKLKNSTKFTPVIIENDDTKATMAQERDYSVIRADGSSSQLIHELYRKGNIAAMLTLKSSDIDNIYFILNAKSIHKESIVYSRMNHAHLLPQYRSSGVDETVQPYMVVDTKAQHYIIKRSNKKGRVTVFGYTHKSKQLCKILKNETLPIIIYENIEENYKNAMDDGFDQVFSVDYEKSRYLEEIQMDDDGIVVCAMDSDALNVYHTISLRSSGYSGDIVTLSDSKEDNRKLILAGVNRIFDMYEESAERFVELIKKGVDV